MKLAGNPAAFLDEHAAPLVSRYFSDEPPLWSGRRFDRLGKLGGSVDPSPDEFAAADLVAVSMLSVEIPAEASIEILESSHEELSELLTQIPASTPIWKASDTDLAEGSPAWRLFDRLDAIGGMGWVSANKLLARKRPHLLPVYDNVVKTALQPHGTHFWLPLRDAFFESDLATKLDHVRSKASIGSDISLLRVLDVAIWMRNASQQTDVDGVPIPRIYP
jgi:hypothetical protein